MIITRKKITQGGEEEAQETEDAILAIDSRFRQKIEYMVKIVSALASSEEALTQRALWKKSKLGLGTGSTCAKFVGWLVNWDVIDRNEDGKLSVKPEFLDKVKEIEL